MNMIRGTFPNALGGCAPQPTRSGTADAHAAAYGAPARALLGLVALHVAAALYHQFIRRDGVLLRMLPFRGG